MLHIGDIEAVQGPALLAQAHAQIELFHAVQIAIGQIADGVDGTAAVEPAAIEPIDGAHGIFDPAPRHATGEFEARQVHLDHMPGDASDARIGIEKGDALGQEVRIEQHVAIEQADIVARAVLIAQLGADAAAGGLVGGELNDGHRIARGNGKRGVGRAAIGNDHLAIGPDAGQRTFNSCGDPLGFVERLDDDRHAHGALAPCMAGIAEARAVATSRSSTTQANSVVPISAA